MTITPINTESYKSPTNYLVEFLAPKHISEEDQHEYLAP